MEPSVTSGDTAVNMKDSAITWRLGRSGSAMMWPPQAGLPKQHSVFGLAADCLHHSLDALLRHASAYISASALARIAASEGVAEKVGTLLRQSALMRLVVVHRQFEPLHHRPHRLHRVFRPAFAANDEIVREVDDVRRPSMLHPQLLPSHDEPPHVHIRQQRGDGRFHEGPARWDAIEGINPTRFTSLPFTKKPLTNLH